MAAERKILNLKVKDRPEWKLKLSKGYYRQAVALSHMGRYTESLASYASALAHDCSNQLLQALVDAALRSPLKEMLEPLLVQLESVDNNNKPFATVALIGQEILSNMDFPSAIIVLESALQIGTEDMLLKASVFSQLTNAYWNIENIKKALHFMHQELIIYETVKDISGMCRVHGNLGSAYYAQEQFSEAKKHYSMQFEMSKVLQDNNSCCAALTSLGRVLVSLEDYPDAIGCHKKCAALQKQMNYHLQEVRELCNVASIHLLLGEFSDAEYLLQESLNVSRKIKQPEERCKALNRIGVLYQNMHNIDQAAKIFQEMLQVSQEIENSDLICQSLSCLGHAYRMQNNLKLAESIHELQLQKAKELGALTLESRALTDLGVTYHHKCKFDKALECHKAHLQLSKKLNDKEGEVKAYGNIGNSYQMIQDYKKAIEYHKLGISCALEIDDKYSEASLHGNLGVAYQSLNLMNEAKEHYEEHLRIAKEMKYLRSECVAESNLGNFCSGLDRLHEAAPHYENHLSVAMKLHDKLEICKAAQNLAHIHYRLNLYTESVKYYEQSLSLANELNAQEFISSAYCELGLVYLAYNDFEKAVRCQKLLLASAQEKKNVFGICKAFGNLGLIYMKMGEHKEAKDFFKEQVCAAEKSSIDSLRCDCHRDFANALASEKLYEEAFEQYEKEIALRRKLSDNKKFFESLFSFANFLERIKEWDYAYKCYCELFQATKFHKDIKNCKKVCNLLGKLNMKMEKYKKAISAFILQLECTEDYIAEIAEVSSVHKLISECYDNLNNFESAMDYLLECQSIAVFTQNYSAENDASKHLSQLCMKYNDFKSALMYSEKRLISSQELTGFDKCDAYKDVAAFHLLLKNYDSSISYYQQLLTLAKEYKILKSEYDAYKGLGLVNAQISNFSESIKWYLLAEGCTDMLDKIVMKAECLVNIGDCYQSSSDFQNALKYYQRALQVCQENDLKTLRVTVCGCIGRTHHSLTNPEKAISYLRMAASLCEQLQEPAEIIKCFYRLGLKFYFENDNDSSSKCFEKVIDLIEKSDVLRTILLSDVLNFIKASYEMLQKIYLIKKEYLQALFVAEKRNIFNLKVLLRSADVKVNLNIPLYSKFIQSLNNVQNTICLYSIVVGQLYCWIIKPNEGFVKFWEQTIDESYVDLMPLSSDLDNFVTNTFNNTVRALNVLVFNLRQSLNVEDRHLFNQSEKIDSLMSTDIELIDHKAKPKCFMRDKSFRLRHKQSNNFARANNLNYNINWHIEAPLSRLYLLFFSQIDKFFDCSNDKFNGKHDLVLVLPCELTLVPFSILKDDECKLFAYERHNIFYSTSLFSLLECHKKRLNAPKEEKILIFGDKACDNEAVSINKVLSSSILITSNSSKEEIIDQISSSTISHIALDVMWLMPGICFPYIDGIVESNCIDCNLQNLDLDDNRQVNTPDIIVTIKDICNSQLFAKLIIFGVNSFGESTICTDGLQALVTSFLMNGCETVLTSQWKIPKAASLFFFCKFYQHFNHGVPVYQAFSDTIKEMQASSEFSHPSNWAGLVIYGRNCQLTKKTCNFIKAFHKFIEVPNRDSLKVILHLVETAQKRLAQDQRTSLYIAEESIHTKVSPTNTNWKPLLVSLGFRFEKAHNNLPDAVFFPEYEYSSILARACNTFYALLGLSKTGLSAVSKLRSSPIAALPLQKIFQDVLYYFNQEMSNVQVSLPLHLWRLPGCHEFLSSLDFDVMGVEKTEVNLRSGKKDTRQALQCAVQSLKDLFDATEDAINTDDASDIKTNNPTINSHSKNSSDTGRKLSFNGDNGLLNESNFYSNDAGGNARRLKNKSSLEGVYGMKKVFSKIDVSDMTMCEEEFEDCQKTIYVDKENQINIGPDVIEQEDIEIFISNFRKTDKLDNDTSSEISNFENEERSSSIRGSFISRSYLTSSNVVVDSINDIKVSKESSPRLSSEELNKRIQKQKLPEEWQRLRLGSDYFNNNGIKTISIRDSFHVHPKDDVLAFRRVSDFSTLSKNSKDSSLSERSHDDGEDIKKKKNWFHRLKKSNSNGNITDESDDSVWTYDSSTKQSKKTRKIKKINFFSNILNKDDDNHKIDNNTPYRYEKSEGNINLNQLYTKVEKKSIQPWLEML